MSMVDIGVMIAMLAIGIGISVFVTYKWSDLKEKNSVLLLEKIKDLMAQYGGVLKEKYPDMYAQAKEILDTMISYLNSDSVSVQDRVAYIYKNAKFFMNLALLVGVVIDKKAKGSGESVEDIVRELE